MQAMSFSFENMPVRTLGNPETPLFVAIDVVKALGFKDTINPIKRHVDPEDLIKVEIETAGGRQTVNAVNESGLYALIFGSKLESAKRFKRWGPPRSSQPSAAPDDTKRRSLSTSRLSTAGRFKKPSAEKRAGSRSTTRPSIAL